MFNNLSLAHVIATCSAVMAVSIQALPVCAAVTYDTRVLSGDSAPGTTGVYSLFNQPQIDNFGRIAFRGILETGTGGVTTDTDRGLWSETSGSLSLVARDGMTAPGTTGEYNSLDTLSLNRSGKIVFGNHLLVGTGGVTSENNGGAWSDTAGPVSLLLREGDAAPGTAGAIYSDFGATPLFNDAGQIAFISRLREGTGGVTTSNDLGVWSGAPGSWSLAAREGSPAPGTGAGVVYGDSYGIHFNNAGKIAFSADLTGSGITDSNDVGIWSNASGTMSLIAREGSTAAGAAGAEFLDFDGLGFNNAGQAAFRGFLVPGTGGVTADNNSGIWSQGAGPLGLVVREGDAAPGVAGTVFDTFSGSQIRDTGDVAFLGKLRLGIGGVTLENNEGMWYENAGSLDLIAREGDPAPGTDGVFSGFNNGPIFNNAGQLVFVGNLRTGIGGVTPGNDRGLWATDANGLLRLIVREGDWIDVDDDPSNEDLRQVRTMADNLGRNPFNDAGQVAYKLSLTGGEGLFVADVKASMAGDLNDDAFVGLDDVNVVLSHWNASVTPADASRGDTSGDGFIGIDDLNVILANWNNGTPPGAGAVPEPGTVTLWGLLGLYALRRRR